MNEIKYGDEIVKILEASGYNDGYYWDMNATIGFREETYRLFDAGSGSGYISNCSGITKCDFERLYGEEQRDVDEDEWGYFEEIICWLLSNFEESGAKESWESMEDDDWNTHILVDGVEVKVEEEEA